VLGVVATVAAWMLRNRDREAHGSRRVDIGDASS
jgi:hypothetical protein